MAADPVDPAELADIARNAPLTRPRPGHADYAGMLKYGFDDARPVLERASARETAARVAAGTVARSFLRQALGVEVISHVIAIGPSAPYDGPPPGPNDLAAIDASPVRAFDKAAEEAMKGTDKDAIEARTQALAQAAQKLGEKMYAQQGAQGGQAQGAPGGGQQAGGKGDDGDVVDAEFEEVKDKK